MDPSDRCELALEDRSAQAAWRQFYCSCWRVQDGTDKPAAGILPKPTVAAGQPRWHVRYSDKVSALSTTRSYLFLSRLLNIINHATACRRSLIFLI
jgi:hypothetical protein